jgi:hypothetical protein
MNLRQFDCVMLGLADIWHSDLDKIGAGGAGGAGGFPGVHAAGGDELGLHQRARGEDGEDGGKILVGEVAGFAAHDAADEASRNGALAGNFTLVELPALCLALEFGAEVAHAVAYVDGRWFLVCGPVLAVNFFAARVAHYAIGIALQHFNGGLALSLGGGLHPLWGAMLFARRVGLCEAGNCQPLSHLNLVYEDCRESAERARWCALVRLAIPGAGRESKNVLYNCYARACARSCGSCRSSGRSEAYEDGIGERIGIGRRGG